MDNNVNGNNGVNNNVTPNMNYSSVNNDVSNSTVGNFNNNMTNTSNSYNDDFMIKKDRKIWPFLLVIIILFIIGL